MLITTEEDLQPVIQATEQLLEKSAERFAVLMGRPVRVRFDEAAEQIYVPSHYRLEWRETILAFRGHVLLWRWRVICKVGGDLFSGAGISGRFLVSIHENWLKHPRYEFFFRKLFADLSETTGNQLTFRGF